MIVWEHLLTSRARRPLEETMNHTFGAFVK